MRNRVGEENIVKKIFVNPSFKHFLHGGDYNDNRKSKFLNFDGKSLICQQFS